MAANFMCYLIVLLSIFGHLAAGIDVTIRGVGTVAGKVDLYIYQIVASKVHSMLIPRRILFSLFFYYAMTSPT